MMCRVIGLNRNSYYSDQRRQKYRPEGPEYKGMMEWIKKLLRRVAALMVLGV